MRRVRSTLRQIPYLNNQPLGWLIDDFPPKRLFVGFDHHGTALEIIVIEDEEADIMYVIHAMQITKQYFYLLEEGGTV